MGKKRGVDTAGRGEKCASKSGLFPSNGGEKRIPIVEVKKNPDGPKHEGQQATKKKWTIISIKKVNQIRTKSLRKEGGGEEKPRAESPVRGLKTRKRPLLENGMQPRRWGIRKLGVAGGWGKPHLARREP